MAGLNRDSTLKVPDEDDKDVAVAEYELLMELSGNIIIEEFERGPFVINHNDLTVQNILVWDCAFVEARNADWRFFRLTMSLTSLVFSTFRVLLCPCPHSASSHGYLVIISLDSSLTAMPISTYF